MTCVSAEDINTIKQEHMWKGGFMHYEIITVVAVDVGRFFHSGKPGEVKQARSAPPYRDMLPKYRELAHDLVTIHEKKVHVVTKFYEPDTVVVEAHAIVEDLFSDDILEFKKSMLKVCSDIARKRDHFADVYEEYSMFCVSGYKDISHFDRHKAHIVGLMRSEVEEMDKDVVEAALRESSLKYSSNDLVVIGWDSAVLFSDQPSEFPEIIEVLTVANIQLLQIRLLNKELESGIDNIGKLLASKKIGWLKLRNTLMQIISLRVRSLFELEQTKADINLLGDWYTANLYSLAAKKFHLDDKMDEIHKRLDALEDVYEMISGRLDSSYMLMMELLITFLIIIELGLAFI